MIPLYMLTISWTFKYPKENAMALGGVAAGSIKANEAEIVAGIINCKGLISNATA